MRNFTSFLALAAFVAIPLTGCSDRTSEYADEMMPETAEVVEATPMNIVETAVAANFNTLVAAVTAADLVGTLSGPGPFTVFAPTDEAFAALPAGTVESLLLPENKDQLVAVLTYHVVPGKVMADQVVGMTTATTVQGSDIQIAVVDGMVKINGATVTSADIETSNGVIHVIDQVILPPSN